MSKRQSEVKDKRDASAILAWLDAVLASPEMSAREKVILLFLGRRRDATRDGQAWPSIPAISNGTSVSGTSVKETLRSLSRKSLLEVLTGDARSNPVRARTNHYRLPPLARLQAGTMGRKSVSLEAGQWDGKPADQNGGQWDGNPSPSINGKGKFPSRPYPAGSAQAETRQGGEIEIHHPHAFALERDARATGGMEYPTDDLDLDDQPAWLSEAPPPVDGDAPVAGDEIEIADGVFVETIGEAETAEGTPLDPGGLSADQRDENDIIARIGLWIEGHAETVNSVFAEQPDPCSAEADEAAAARLAASISDDLGISRADAERLTLRRLSDVGMVDFDDRTERKDSSNAAASF